jgi:hypothetical protein
MLFDIIGEAMKNDVILPDLKISSYITQLLTE